MKERVRALLDRQLGRVTMYRLVTIVLGLLVVVMVVYTATGTFADPFSVTSELITLVVLLAASHLSSRACGLLWRVGPHTESSIITALLLWFLFWPSTDAVTLAWVAAAAALANVSKYVLAWRGRHVFNPAAAGAVLVIVAQDLVGREDVVAATWWIASQQLLPYVVVGAFLVLWRTRRLDLGVLFVLLAGVLIVWGLTAGFGSPFGEAVRTTAYSFPLVFMAGFMLSEPLTLPPRRWQQLLVATVAAVVAGYPVFVAVFGATPISVGPVAVTPEVTLLIANLVSFALARRQGLTFVLEEHRSLTPETYELTFRPSRGVSFRPGQYAELTLPHRGADGRGSRRTFSITSPPGDRVSFALRVPAESSSFKQALLALRPGEAVRATGVAGDFLWPSDRTMPLLLVAGGIGVTPFLSQLRHDAARDVVLVYGATSADEVPFIEELARVRVVLVCPARPAELPQRWSYVEAPVLSAGLIAEAVPDLASRRAYVSGPPAMVNAVRPGLARRCAGVRTDYFTGY